MRRAAALARAALTLAPAAARAQWMVDLGAGRAVHDPVAARVSVLSASAGVRYQNADESRWLYLSGGAPLDEEGPAWGAGGAGLWTPLRAWGDVSLALRSGAHLFGYGATDSIGAGGGATVEAAPVVTVARGPVRADAYAGVLAAGETGDFREEWRPFFDTGATLALSPRPGGEVAAEGRWLRGEEGGWPYAGVSARAVRGPVQAWAFGGRWLVGDSVLASPRAAYGGGASVAVGWGSELSVSWQQEPASPVYLTAPRRSWSVQLSRTLGRPPVPREPIVPVTPVVEDGRVVISIPAGGHDAAPSVVGDFTGWQPVPMTRDGSRWTARLALAPGTYHYGFRSAAGEWFVPPALPVVDDGMGGTSAVLVVP